MPIEVFPPTRRGRPTNIARQIPTDVIRVISILVPFGHSWAGSVIRDGDDPGDRIPNIDGSGVSAMDVLALENLWRAWIVTAVLSGMLLLCLSGVNYGRSFNAMQPSADEFWLMAED